MVTGELLAKVLPPLTWLRENVFMKISELLSRVVQLDVMNIYNFLMIIVSLWLANKILGQSYKTLIGRWTYLFLISALIFYVLRFLGAS
jgi:hypothetical protein